jgi:hypothetical protein
MDFKGCDDLVGHVKMVRNFRFQKQWKRNSVPGKIPQDTEVVMKNKNKKKMKVQYLGDSMLSL